MNTTGTNSASRIGGRRRSIGTCGATVLAWSLAAAVSAASEPPAAAVVFATVGGAEITVGDYAVALREEARRRFYHGRPAEAELKAFQREVADKLIERELAAQEAVRRSLRPDAKAIDGELARLRDRAKRAGSGHKPPAQALWRVMRERLEHENLERQLRTQVQSGIPVDEPTLRMYYSAHPEKFTEPAANAVSVILLKVEASAPKAVWDAAWAEAARLHARLRAGDDFGELARVHSGDTSAAKGGDLGYMHSGRLGHTVEGALAKLRPGQIADPMMVLEGIAIFRLDARREPKLNAFESVRDRAEKLWTQAEGNRRWQALMARLRATTPLSVAEQYLDPRGAQTAQSGLPRRNGQ